jgi:hypothetical protein
MYSGDVAALTAIKSAGWVTHSVRRSGSVLDLKHKELRVRRTGGDYADAPTPRLVSTTCVAFCDDTNCVHS